MVKLDYCDYDGVSILYDAHPVAARYGERGETFEYSVAGDLCKLMNAQEAAAFGMRAGGELVAEVVVGGAAKGLDCGVVKTTGAMVLAGWHAFTMACDCDGGVLESVWNGRFEVPAGRYRVFVDRRFDEHDAATGVTITMTADDTPIEQPYDAVPGGDGFF